MKTKMLKKLIAVLCAATMSASIIAPTGAIYYQNDSELSNYDRNYVANLNNTIFNMGENIKEMKRIVNGLNNIPGKQNMFYQLDSIYRSLSSMHNGNLSCPNKTIIVNFNNSILQIKTNIEQTLNLLRAGTIRVNDFNSSIYNIDAQLKRLYQDTISAIQYYNMNVNIKNMAENQFKNGLNQNNIMKNNNIFFHNQDAWILNNLQGNILNMRNRMLVQNNNPHANPLQIKLTNKREEVNRRVEDARKFVQHRNLDEQPIQNIYNEFLNKYHNLDPMNKDDATIQQGIKLIDDTIQKLNKFTLNNDRTIVIPNQKSGLKREANNKLMELKRLLDCAKRSYNANFSGNPLTNQAISFYSGINLHNPNSNEVSDQLRQAITYFDAAIASIRHFDDSKKSKTTIWEEEASKNIDRLLNQATEEMKRSSNQTTIAGIKQEFQPLLCGKQHYGNCWLHAIRNILNIGAHIKGQHNNIVKNTGVRDANGFDNVERFFAQPQFGLSEDKIKNIGGTLQEESNILSNLGINHSMITIDVNKNDAQSREVNTKIVKTLLLKHFAKSITPVLINNRYDECSINVNNGAGGNHAMAIVGLDFSQNSVVVADSNYQDLQVYSLDRISSTICNHGMTDHNKKDIGMIFPSFTNTNNFNYNNLYHSWAEFESQLLPAISKAL